VLLNSVGVLPTGATNACVDIDDAPDSKATFHSVFLSCPVPFRDDTNTNAAATAAIFNAGTNNVSNGTSTLTGRFINGTNEAGRPPFAAATISTFFVNTSYIGAVRDASDTWWQGWTCGLPGQPAC
jgi:hypothetical protein